VFCVLTEKISVSAEASELSFAEADAWAPSGAIMLTAAAKAALV
jgi:hypothetical protein